MKIVWNFASRSYITLTGKHSATWILRIIIKYLYRALQTTENTALYKSNTNIYIIYNEKNTKKNIYTKNTWNEMSPACFFIVRGTASLVESEEERSCRLPSLLPVETLYIIQKMSEITWSLIIYRFKDIKQYLIFDSGINRQPVECMQKVRRSLVLSAGEDQARSFILKALNTRLEIWAK